MAERNRLLTQYFPQRSTTVLSQIQNFAPVDNFVATRQLGKGNLSD
jgi:hypothetical protein